MKKLALVLVISVLVFSVVGCNANNETGSQTDIKNQSEEVKDLNNDEDKNKTLDEKIIVYVSGPEEMINKLEETFEAERGDVIDMIKMSCGQVRSKVWAEQESGKIQADIIWGSDPLIYNKLEEKNLLEKVNIEDIQNIKDIKDEYVLKDKNYILVNERYITIMYNKNDFKEEQLPKSYDDLTKKQYKDMLVIADASQSSTALAITSAIYQMKGMEYLKKLKDNGVFLSKSNGQVPSKIMEGQFSLGIGPHDSVVRLKNKAKKDGYEMPVEIIWPSEGAIAIQRPIALVRDDTRSEEQTKVANEFINFIISKKAQKITEKFGFASVRKDIENKYIPESQNIVKIDWGRALLDEEKLTEYYKELFQR
ncbi:hypothetical protein Y919_03575 [Caloranaerobacter azorensis H53214]|uniref:ABC transporter substrate-binding protein n=1 Tax=Caloranaerobacter azorensis H53214 TaxID=1156417 RepID=A0A096CWG8_9FIRM|nr:extracellular solute-binding protein [Caloranaerobacter azorensis]KGG80919.1 hypothetical protein Y919_03575 [Caloranaerobacter azorensis H53214]